MVWLKMAIQTAHYAYESEDSNWIYAPVILAWCNFYLYFHNFPLHLFFLISFQQYLAVALMEWAVILLFADLHTVVFPVELPAQFMLSHLMSMWLKAANLEPPA